MNEIEVRKWGFALKDEMKTAKFFRASNPKEIPEGDWGRFGQDNHPKSSIETSGLFFNFIPFDAKKN